MTRPLEGLKVVDFSTVVAGPVLTRLLADHGATVVKIESAHRPDGLRSMTPYKGGRPGMNRSGYFAMYNAGKLSLTVNMRKPQAREFFRRHLVPWADLIVEAFMPGVADRWGVTWEEVSAIKPEVILLRSCLMGHSGPDMRLKGTGQITAALSGWYDLTGWPDGLPVGPYSAYSDFVSWNYATIAVMAALDHRRRTGKGQYIDQSLFESTIQFAGPAVLDYTVNGVVQSRCGNRDPRAAPHGAYPCQGDDRWCVIAVTTDEEWRRFAQAIGSPAWAHEARFASLEGRKAEEDELDMLVARWTARHPPEEVMARLQAAGVPAGVVQNARDLFNDPQLKHREAFVVRDHPEMGPHHIYTSSFRLSDSPNAPEKAAPVLGEHTEYVCRELLGITEEDLAEWIADEVLE